MTSETWTITEKQAAKSKAALDKFVKDLHQPKRTKFQCAARGCDGCTVCTEENV